MSEIKAALDADLAALVELVESDDWEEALNDAEELAGRRPDLRDAVCEAFRVQWGERGVRDVAEVWDRRVPKAAEEKTVIRPAPAAEPKMRRPVDAGLAAEVARSKERLNQHAAQETKAKAEKAEPVPEGKPVQAAEPKPEAGSFFGFGPQPGAEESKAEQARGAEHARVEGPRPSDDWYWEAGGSEHEQQEKGPRYEPEGEPEAGWEDLDADEGIEDERRNEEWKLRRMQGALKWIRPEELGPVGIEGIGSVIWRMRGGDDVGFLCWSKWAGQASTKDRWDRGWKAGNPEWTQERIWTLAQRKGWRFPVMASAHRFDVSCVQSERALVRRGVEVYQIRHELVRPVVTLVPARKGRKILGSDVERGGEGVDKNAFG
jgi:hypothetical protein